MKEENFPESTNLNTSPSDNHASGTFATFMEDDRKMSSTVEQRGQILHHVKPTTLSECSITTGSENEQNIPYFSLESQ